jgi:hypothetical protein
MRNKVIDISFRSTSLFVVFIALITLGSITTCFAESGAAYSHGPVKVNGRELTAAEKQDFLQVYGALPIPGEWWYDSKSGLYGLMGQSAMGSMNPGHDFGAMPANASQGDSGVYLNGRQLPAQELQIYAMVLGQIEPGRYWMDAGGNFGKEGQAQGSNQAMPASQYPDTAGGTSVPQHSSPGYAGNAGGDSRLIGVFAGESISSGAGGYYNTQLNWVFNADGSVIYGAQGHYSASQKGYDGNDVWTASGQTEGSAERGRWTTSGKLLTIQWESGEVTRVAYSFEPDGSLVYRNPNTNKLINYFPRVR